MNQVYDGGGTNNALQTDTTAAAVVASGAEVLNASGANYIRVYMGNTTQSQSGTLLVSCFTSGDADTAPTTAQLENTIEQTLGSTSNTATVDSAPFTGTAGTTVYVLDPLLIYIGTANRVMLNMAASGGGTWYARYELING